MALVVDVSIVAKWFLADEKNSFANSILDHIMSDAAYVPALFRWEIENSLLTAERANRITPDEVDIALERLRDIPIVIEPVGDRFFPSSDVRLARHCDVTPYDAAYLDVAASRRLPLATADADLAYAARDLGIEVLFDDGSK
jgi:predicted nucleic acid-binding protein